MGVGAPEGRMGGMSMGGGEEKQRYPVEGHLYHLVFLRKPLTSEPLGFLRAMHIPGPQFLSHCPGGGPGGDVTLAQP